MKDEKFRELLREYAEEISDPENRRVCFHRGELRRQATRGG